MLSFTLILTKNFSQMGKFNFTFCCCPSFVASFPVGTKGAGTKISYQIFCHRSLSMLRENTRKTLVFYVFWGYRMRPVVMNAISRAKNEFAGILRSNVSYCHSLMVLAHSKEPDMYIFLLHCKYSLKYQYLITWNEHHCPLHWSPKCWCSKKLATFVKNIFSLKFT